MMGATLPARLKDDRVNPLVDLVHKVPIPGAEGVVSTMRSRASKADMDIDIDKDGLEMPL